MNPYLSASRRSFLIKLSALSIAPIMVGASEKAAAKVLARKPAGKFVPVMLTPFQSNLAIDFDTLSRLIDFYEAAGAKGFFANCLSSEMYHLTPEERLQVTSHVVKRVQGKFPVVASGSFGASLEEKVAFTSKIHATGVDAVILISSHFVEKEESDQVFRQRLEKFLSASGSIPLGTYEAPNPYKRIISPEVYSFLVQSGRFIYHKDTSEDLEVMKIKIGLSKDTALQLFNAHSGTTVSSIQAGAAGMSPISGNFYPEIIVWMCENAHNKDKQEDLRWIQSEILQTESIISNTYPVSAKYFLQQRGLPIQTVTRSSDRILSEEQVKVLKSVNDRFLGWCERLGIEPVKL